VIAGRFVYHCHAVDHEDKGMMGVVEVVALRSIATVTWAGNRREIGVPDDASGDPPDEGAGK